MMVLNYRAAVLKPRRLKENGYTNILVKISSKSYAKFKTNRHVGCSINETYIAISKVKNKYFCHFIFIEFVMKFLETVNVDAFTVL